MEVELYFFLDSDVIYYSFFIRKLNVYFDCSNLKEFFIWWYKFVMLVIQEVNIGNFNFVICLGSF